MRKTPLLPMLTILAFCGLVAGMTGCGKSAEEKAALRASDIATCSNLISRQAWYHSAFLDRVALEKLWVTRSGNRSTAAWAENGQYWIGMDAIPPRFGTKIPREQTKAQFRLQTLSTSVVEIAGDRKTAKGVWYSPGISGSYPRLSGSGERVAVDFANEKGEWKIWHLHVYSDVDFPISSDISAGGGNNTSASQGGKPKVTPATLPPAPPATPETSAAPDASKKAEEKPAPAPVAQEPDTSPQIAVEAGYAKLSEARYPDLIPRPPEPYKTFSDTWSYGDPNEMKMFGGEYREWADIKVGK